MKHIRRVLALVLLAIMVATMASAEVNADVTNFTSEEQLNQILAGSELYCGDLGTMETEQAIDAFKARSDFEEIKAKCKTYAKSTGKSIFYLGTFIGTEIGNKAAYIVMIFVDGQFNDVGYNEKDQVKEVLPLGSCFAVTKPVPKTGDETPVALLCVLLAGAAAGIIALRRRQAQGA